MIIVSSWSAAGAVLYGDRFLKTHAAAWPEDVCFHVFVEGAQPRDDGRIRVEEFLNLPSWKTFLRTYSPNPSILKRLQGRDLTGLRVKEREREAGYSYRFDAWKFSRKFFALAAAHAQADPEETIVWLDGDTVPRGTIPASFQEQILPSAEPWQFAYLGRDTKHSETGFLAFKPAVRWLIPELEEAYLSGAFLDIQEGWTDSDVFDEVVLRKHALIGNNLSRPPRQGAVFERSILGHYMTHLKGNRKFAA
jgi:hypothetical protein